MNLLQNWMRSVKIVGLTLSFLSSLMILFSTPAMADTGTVLDAITECVTVNNGVFSVNVPAPVPQDITIRSAVVSLPPGQSGTLKEITITGPDGVREFGCVNIKIKDGTDLIKSCGGPAVLKAGCTDYLARGVDFGPLTKTKFCVNLSTDFKS